MNDFYINIADTNICIKPMYEAVYEFCKDYMCEECEADFTVETTPEDIAFERAYEETHGIHKQTIPKDYPDSYLEIVSVYRKIAEELINRDTILLHGSSISIDGNGMIFIADSGVGKSTHSRHWQECFGDRVVMINDDKPLIKVDEDGATIYGTPWSGKMGLNTNVKVPLKFIFKLNRGEDRVENIDKNKMWEVLMQQVYKSKDIMKMQKTISIIDRLTGNVPVYNIYCTDSVDAAKCVYEFIEDSLR